MGDGMLVEFPSVVDAVNAAVDTQRALATRNDVMDLSLFAGFLSFGKAAPLLKLM